MEVGTEISQKIRSAIKAKLMELGAYVDDELPDYIMVMVANKKSRAQMNSDLGLFLGTNTSAFTEWLHSLLGKLQTIRGETDKSSDKHGKGEKSKGSKDKKKEKDKSHKGESSGKKDAKDKKKTGKRSTDIAVKRKAASEAEGSKETEPAIDADNSNPQNKSSNEDMGLGFVGGNKRSGEKDTSEKKTGDKSKNTQDDVEDVRQLLVTEAPSDELAEELETTEAEVVSSRTVTDISSKPAGVSRKRKSSDVSPSNASRSPSPDKRNVQTSNVTRKRRAPTSVVASVSRGQDDEEEYDPYNPAVGSVASVVKVTTRKSSVPPSMQANRALLVKAMTEAERSIAVKRKVAVTRPISRDDSPSEVYSPKRKRSEASQEEASPPPYIPSRKDSIGRHGSGGSSLRSERGLSHDDARHTLSREDRRELISKSRREELLRTIGIDRKSSHRLESSGSPEKGRRRSDEDKNMNIRFEREVKSDRKLGGIKNFQITTRVLPQKVLSSHDVEMSRQGSVSPELKQSVQVTVSPRSVANSKASITARLGKVVVERRDSAESEEAEEDQDSRSATLKSKSDQRDAREDINAKAALSKAQNSTLYKSGARSISRLAKEAVQKQCEAAVMSVRASRISDKGKGHMSPDSREVQYDTDSLGSREDEQEEDVKKKEKMDVQVKSGMPRDISGSVSRPKDNESGDEDETEDLDKMIDDDLAPELLEDTANDEFTLDLDDEDLSNVVGAIEEEAVQADMQENEKADQSKPGTRFIVTLDGVDERQFDSVDSAFEKFRQSPLGLAAPGLPVASVSAAIPEQLEQNQKLFLDLLASQGRAIPPTLIQQAQISASTTSSKLTPPKIQPFSISLKDSDDEHDDKEAKQSTSASRQGSYHQAQGEEELEMSALKRARMSERCKFWPACAAGTSCEYHHPTTHCKTFPNCKFGDKCLFIHPNCRFDSKCARPDCPYTHTSRRSNLGSTAHVIAIPQSHVFFTPTPPKPPYGSYLASGYSSAQTVCRYFPNCHNLTCPFLHPKPCRFGSACKSAACPFYHPPVPTKDKLKWQAQSVAPKGQTAAFLGHVKMEPGVSKLASTPVQSSSTTVSSTSQ